LNNRQPLQQIVLGKPYITCTKLKLEPFLSLCTKINTKWIRDVNISSETLKLIKENKRKFLEDTGIGNTFLNRTPIAQEMSKN
jgi:hypothetical protein